MGSSTRWALILGVVLLVGIVAVVVLQRGGDDAQVQGGPLLTVDLSQADHLVISRAGLQWRLERHGGIHWSMRGAFTDWVDPVRLGSTLVGVGAARGGPVLLGTEPDDRRYEFNGPRGVRLLVRAGDREDRLALGATNPVSGHVYASGVGRSACFPVETHVRDLIAGLPQQVRLNTLLPETPLESLTELVLDRGRRRDVFVPHEGSWWLETSGPDDPRLPRLFRDYQAHYDDRRRSENGRHFAKADTRRLRGLLYAVSQTNVRNFVEAPEAPGYIREWGLDTAWQRVLLEGSGIDPDPMTDDPDHLVISFGEPLDEHVVPVMRRGNPLLARREAVAPLEQPVGDFLDTRALDFHPLATDTITLSGPTGVLLRMARDPSRPVRFEGRRQWDALLPEPVDKSLNDMAQSTAVGLERLTILTVLPPTRDPSVVEDGEVLRMVFVTNDPPSRREFLVGRLVPDRLPAGTETLVREGIEGPVGLWEPAGGRLLQIPASLLITGRALAN